MDALKHLTTNVPGWQRRLDELGGQIAKRQVELAALAGKDGFNHSDARSLRDRGSTESLKPRDEGPPHPDHSRTPINRPDLTLETNLDGPQDFNTPTTGDPITPTQATQHEAPPTTSPGIALHQQARDAMMAAHAKNRADVRQKQHSSSMVSLDGSPSLTYRTRSMIIVYYDSYVQGFFDELARFISLSRNMIRKAKMAAKVAQIKRMADAGDGDDQDAAAPPSLRYLSTRRFGSVRATLGTDGPTNDGAGNSDVYQQLDKLLDAVQSACEHGAHQFLRDADCSEELAKIQKHMAQLVEIASAEVERVAKEDPDAVDASLEWVTPELGKIRTRKPITLRRHAGATNGSEKEKWQQGLGADDGDRIRPEIPLTPPISATSLSNGALASPLLAKEDAVTQRPAAHKDHDGYEMILPGNLADLQVQSEIPVLHYRSTRNMRSRPPISG